MSELDLVSKLSPAEQNILFFRMRCISPDDGKYGKKADPLREYLSAGAEWLQCAKIQKILIETRCKFGQATKKQVKEVENALEKVSPENMSLLEDKINHDQLAVIEEIGRYVSPETKALLHPGTTSYDILDTARSYLFKEAWNNVIRPEVSRSIDQLCDIAERSIEILQTGRTHLQNTSPVLFGGVIAGYATRIANRAELCDLHFNTLKGKISGIVGTGASIETVIGEGKGTDFEEAVLKKLGLKPDYTATQIVQKEAYADVGHGLTTLMYVLHDFANDIRMLYSSAIKEVTSRDNAERLGGSSADATKNNPIEYENMAGKAAVVESGMRILYAMIPSDFQRDLRNSVQGRYQPQQMMAEVYESFKRLNKALPQLSINEDKIAQNLEAVRNNPGEAMTAILRAKGWVHPKGGVGHDFVKETGKEAIKTGKSLICAALGDEEFKKVYETFSHTEKQILNGELEYYTGFAYNRAQKNIKYARSIASVQKW